MILSQVRHRGEVLSHRLRSQLGSRALLLWKAALAKRRALYADADRLRTRVHQRLLRNCWVTWVTYNQLLQRRKAVMHGLLWAKSHNYLILALDVWKLTVRNALEVEKLLGHAEQHHREAVIGRCFASWMSNCAELRTGAMVNTQAVSHRRT